jgi:hypothetical protein
MENFVNPKVKDFLKQHSEMTLLGLSWAIYWRMGIVIFTIAFFLTLIPEL